MFNRLFPGLLCVCLLSASLLTACGKEPQRAEPVSAEVRQQKQEQLVAELNKKYPPRETESSAPLVTVSIEESREAAKHSGGLGLDMAALEMHHGKIVEGYDRFGDKKAPAFEKNDVASLVGVSKQKYAVSIIYSGIPPALENMADVHPYVMKYLPIDSQLMDTKSYEFPGDDIRKIYNHPVETYYSAWLVTRLSPDEWRNYGPPGQFYINYMGGDAYIELGTYTPAH